MSNERSSYFHAKTCYSYWYPHTTVTSCHVTPNYLDLLLGLFLYKKQALVSGLASSVYSVWDLKKT